MAWLHFLQARPEALHWFKTEIRDDAGQKSTVAQNMCAVKICLIRMESRINHKANLYTYRWIVLHTIDVTKYHPTSTRIHFMQSIQKAPTSPPPQKARISKARTVAAAPKVTFNCPPPPLESRPHSSSDTTTQDPFKEQILMSPKFDMNRKANQAALLRSSLLSPHRYQCQAQPFYIEYLNSDIVLFSRRAAHAPDEAAGVIDHGKELDDAMQTKDVNCPQFLLLSQTSPLQESIQNHCSRDYAYKHHRGQRVANERLKVLCPHPHMLPPMLARSRFIENRCSPGLYEVALDLKARSIGT
ncbi:hypothetical protein CPB85DRAFT_1459793 [Mucidula mucida]|nr:hypothetical protein CPB85DRAFT_1459793 [Mucidula mucida]